MPDRHVPWAREFPEYAPPYHVDPEVLAQDRTSNPRGWAEPEDLARVTRPFQSFEGALRRDASGRPLNPRGRTGLAGRGLLGAWGANFAADPVVTRVGGNGDLELLIIKRRDNGTWALPGGMADPGETVTRTLARELKEEAGVRIDFGAAREVWRGYVDDERNTDHAWMETVVRHVHLEIAPERLRPGDDAKAARWMSLDRETLQTLYADHGAFVRNALRQALETQAFPDLLRCQARIEPWL